MKRVAVDDNEVEKALREVRAMAQLDHPGIIRYNGAWIEQPPEGWQFDADVEMLENLGLPRNYLKSSMHWSDRSVFIYIQMQLCNYSLSDWLKEQPEQSPRDISRMRVWFKQMVSAVEHIHANNLIHRDLKPSNILYFERDVLKLCDLGIATQRREEEQFETERSRTVIGTRLYMSPEQLLNHHYSSQTDVFSLGLILAELCVPMSPAVRAQVFDNFRRGVTNHLIDDVRTESFIRLLTQVDPSKRPTCEEMLQNLFLA